MRTQCGLWGARSRKGNASCLYVARKTVLAIASDRIRSTLVVGVMVQLLRFCDQQDPCAVEVVALWSPAGQVWDANFIDTRFEGLHRDQSARPPVPQFYQQLQ
jgi:hypothetical protein